MFEKEKEQKVVREGPRGPSQLLHQTTAQKWGMGLTRKLSRTEIEHRNSGQQLLQQRMTRNTSKNRRGRERRQSHMRKTERKRGRGEMKRRRKRLAMTKRSRLTS